MKFKVTPKDFSLFCLYCVILLYFCAIAILNIVSLTHSGTFHGLNPFPAFLPQYIGYTFGLFITILVLIFTSVSSYIFSKDKGEGFGFHLNIKEKSGDGYAKWSSEKDIKNDKGIEKVSSTDMNITAAGIPLINKGKEMWVDNGEYHNLVIGATGSGKSETVVKPLVNLLSKKGESMIITDPKGELYEYCGEFLKQQGYKIIVLNFRDPEKGNSWNPLSLPYRYYKAGNSDKGIELLDDVAQNILYNKDNKGDDFWEKSAADFFSGLALGLFEDADEKEVNINSISYMSSVGDERYGRDTYLKQYFTAKGEDSTAYMFANNTISAPQDTKLSIMSTFRQKIRQFTTKESLSEMLSYSDFDMTKIGDEKTAVFMIIHDEKKTYHGLMTIFIKQCYEALIDKAFENGGKLKYRTNFILDEFQNMPPLKDVDSMVTAARSRDIRLTFIIQTFAGLNDVYGENVAQTIKGSCGNLIFLISTELKALEEISKMCGEVKSKEKDKTASTPLVTISDLQKMKMFDALILRWRMSPFKTSMTPNFKIDWGINLGKCELPTRNKNSVELFDIKKFVSNAKRDEQFDSPMGGGNPFMSGGFNPFMSEPAPRPNPFNPFASNQMEDRRPNPFIPNDDIFTSTREEKRPNPFKIDVDDSTNNSSNPFGSITSDEIDEYVKDIERKLAELEEEERKEEEKQKQLELNKVEVEPTIENKTDAMDMTQEINLNSDVKPEIKVDTSSEVISDNVVTDDEYYDDFF